MMAQGKRGEVRAALGYPKSHLAVEHPVAFGSDTKRADIVVFGKGIHD